MAGEYIEFNNNSQPAINDTNLNRLQQLIKQDIQGVVSGDTLPIGVIMPFGSDTIPDNWLLCNGQAVSRTTYQELFNAIGTTYGTGDGFTTFNLPNLQGKVPVGKNANDTDFDTLGETGGEKTHTLTINEMPSHNHQREQTGRALYWDENLTEMGGLASGVNVQTSWNRNTTNTGGSQPHNNLQPYIVQNYIIKAKQSAGVVATVVDNLTSTSAINALSANQGRILNEKTQKHIITAKGGSSEIATTSSGNKLTMATATTIGNKLTLTNDGGIKIGAGVTKVAISASTTYTGGDVSQHALLIYKNSKAAENSLARVLFNSSSNIQTTIIIPYQIVSVSENDILYLFASSSVNKFVSGPMSYMTVEVVE